MLLSKAVRKTPARRVTFLAGALRSHGTACTAGASLRGASRWKYCAAVALATALIV